MIHWLALFVVVALAICHPMSAVGQAGAQIRVGMIGLDRTHVPAFARFFNGPALQGELAGIKVVAADPGGTGFPPSRDRVAKFTEQIRGMGIEIVDPHPGVIGERRWPNPFAGGDTGDQSGLTTIHRQACRQVAG